MPGSSAVPRVTPQQKRSAATKPTSAKRKRPLKAAASSAAKKAKTLGRSRHGTPKKPPVEKKPTPKLKSRGTDLNARFSPGEQAVRATPQTFAGGEIWFDCIETRILDRIKDPLNKFALVASPWLSSQTILRTLASALDGVAVLTNRDKATRSALRTKAFLALPPLAGYARVRYIGAGSGRKRSHPHQKFLVFLDADHAPREVVVGSYNLSGGSETSLETMVLLRCADAAAHYAAEFDRIAGIARVLHR